MARSIIGGLVNHGFDAKRLFASAPRQTALAALQADFGIHPCATNRHAVEQADVVVLAVKPQVMKAVCQELQPSLQAHTLVVSIAAGIPCGSLAQWLHPAQPIVRCMPNTPALVGAGASGLYASANVSATQKQLAGQVLSAVGTVHWVDSEDLIDVVTAVSGSGPAYFFLMLEAMVAAGVAQGLDAATARALAIQTASGAAKLAQASDVDLAELRRRVTSPGGTTEQAILSFERSNFGAIVEEAMQACADRSRQMANELCN